MKSLILFLSALLATAGFAQRDTLHLNYSHSMTKLADTSIKKIDKWIASLKGQPVKIKVYAYYSKSDYEKFAQERSDELFLILNRKARELLKIETIGPKKGKTWQRSMVDIVYDAPQAAVAEPARPEPVKEAVAAETREPEKPAEKKEEKAPAAEPKAEQKPVAAEPKEEKKPAVATEKKKAAAEKKEEKKAAVAAAKEERREVKSAEPENRTESNQAPVAAEPVRSAPKGVGNASDLEKFTVPTDEEFSAKTLVIGLPGEEGPEYEKAKKKGEPLLSEYTKFASSFGEAARNVFNQRWKYSKVTLVPMAEAQRLSKESDKVVVMYTKKESGAVPVMNFDLRSAGYENNIRVTLSGAQPEESDFNMLQHKIARLFNVRREFERDQLKVILAARKLYIGSDQLDMAQDQIAQSYPYPFVVVDAAELKRVIASGETGAAYLKPESVKGAVNMALVDAPTGLILSRAPGASKGKLNSKTLADLVDVNKQLQEITPLTVY